MVQYWTKSAKTAWRPLSSKTVTSATVRFSLKEKFIFAVLKLALLITTSTFQYVFKKYKLL
jgi:hypothetical protein